MNPIDEVMTTKEAAAAWGMPQNTIQYACTGQKGYPPRFSPAECRKSAGTWLVTRTGMTRLYGEIKETP